MQGPYLGSPGWRRGLLVRWGQVSLEGRAKHAGVQGARGEAQGLHAKGLHLLCWGDEVRLACFILHNSAKVSKIVSITAVGFCIQQEFFDPFVASKGQAG